jgi:N-acylneuraminate cytidylyltransferase
VVEVFELTAVDIDPRARRDAGDGARRGAGSGGQIEVDVVITDFDGVHTDDSVLVDQDGRESVRSAGPTGWAWRCLRQRGRAGV